MVRKLPTSADDLPSPQEFLSNFREEDHGLVIMTIGLALMSGDFSQIDKLNQLPFPPKKDPMALILKALEKYALAVETEYGYRTAKDNVPFVQELIDRHNDAREKRIDVYRELTDLIKEHIRG